MDTVEEIAGYAEQARRNDDWWYWLGYHVGYQRGQAEAQTLIDAIRLDREAIALEHPLPNPSSPSYAELQRRRNEVAA